LPNPADICIIVLIQQWSYAPMVRTRPFRMSATVFGIFALAACSSGGQAEGQATDYAKLRDFTGVSAVGPDDVIVSVGKPFAVRADGDPRALATLRIRVEDGKLVIGREKGWHGWFGRDEDGKGAVIHVSMPAIRDATVAGSGNMRVDGAKTESLSLSLAGSGDLAVSAIAADRVKADIAGSGTMTLAGAGRDADLSIVGSGDVKAPSLSLGRASVSIAGSGSVEFRSDGPVSADLLGSGDVTVHGRAQCRVNALGSGEAHCGA
jgi:hypothetical protein